MTYIPPGSNHLQRQLAEKRRIDLALPYIAREHLTSGIKYFRTQKRGLVWGLEDSTFEEDAKHFGSERKAYSTAKLKTPTPRLYNAIDIGHATEIALRVKVGLGLLDSVDRADLYSLPIVLFYSVENLFGALLRAHFVWDHDRLGHGLCCVPAHAANLDDVSVEITYGGAFGRLASYLFLTTGQPTCFDEFVTHSGRQSQHSNIAQNCDITLLGKSLHLQRLKSLTLKDLASLNLNQLLQGVKTTIGFHKFNGYPSAALLRDFILLFAASSIARYSPIYWMRIIEGVDNGYFPMFREVFNRFQLFTVDLVLAMLESPQKYQVHVQNVVVNVPNPFISEQSSW